MTQAHPTLDEIRAELRKGRIYEAAISEAGLHISGVCHSDGKIVVNKYSPELADTIAHELIHRMHPRWGEKRVHRETARLIRGMTETEVAALIKAYRRIVKPAPALHMDDSAA